MRKLIASTLGACLLVACSDSDNSAPPAPPPTVTPPPPAPEVVISAEIRRTDFGIPHIKADDWTSLGYGFGYAYAQDN